MSELLEVTLRSLTISGTATLLATTWSLLATYALLRSRGRLKDIVLSVTHSLVSIPTVVIGLTLFILLSEEGPLGFTGMLYTPVAITIGEAILITPLMISLLYEALKTVKETYWELAMTLGASETQAVNLMIREGLPRLLLVVLMGFARAVSELGVALIVGGNIKGYTRVLTTAISLEVRKGNFEGAIYMGVVLLVTVLTISLLVNWLRRRLGS